jgi:hypothetical protein
VQKLALQVLARKPGIPEISGHMLCDENTTFGLSLTWNDTTVESSGLGSYRVPDLDIVKETIFASDTKLNF